MGEKIEILNLSHQKEEESEPNQHTTMIFTENLLQIEINKKKKKTEILMNKPL